MDKRQTQELIDISQHLFVQTSQFTEGLGLHIESMEAETASMRFTNRDDLTGSERTTNLHGGVIASVLDITGSLAVFSNLVYRMKDSSLNKRIEKVTRINTIDLRIDYIRPASGTSFVATGYVMRSGRTVAVSRIELHGEDGRLAAVGTGSYIVAVK
ncbi:MAG: thioesterase family protein [Dehalococcoidia bacterium]